MKKIYLLTAIALVAGVSCTKQVTVENNSPDMPIVFEPVAQKSATKAQVFGEQNATYSAYTTANTYEKFKAFAAFSENALTTPATTVTAEFFTASGVTCSPYLESTTLKYWKADGSYYWPKTGYLTFHAFSPSDAATLTHSWNGGFTLTNFSVATDASQQVDVMYSDFEFNKRRNKGANDYTTPADPYDDENDGTYLYEGVNLMFHHALASIKFEAKVESDNYAAKGHTFKIKKIEVLYPYQTGTFHENRANADLTNAYLTVPVDESGYENIAYRWAATTSPYWAVDTSSELTPADSNTDGDWDANTTYVAYNKADYSAALTSSATAFHDVANYSNDILAMPQSLAHASNNVSAKVTYQYTFDDGVNPAYTAELSTTVSLAGANGSDGSEGAQTINKWLINHVYVYTFNFKLEEIIFDPAVTNFVQVNVDVIDLPNVDI